MQTFKKTSNSETFTSNSEISVPREKIIFGPVLSRRFGHSLGIDLSPTKKQCNFDCLYCELNAARALEQMSEIVSVDCVFNAIDEALKNMRAQNIKIDVLTFTANGEPTLYPHLHELILRVKKLLDSENYAIQTLILSNGSLFWRDDVAVALMEFDMVKFSLDSVISKNFWRVDRAHRSLDLSKIMAGILEFSHKFLALPNKKLLGEILLVKGVNDDENCAIALNDFFNKVKPTRLDISTIDRPSAHPATPLSADEIKEFARHFENLNVNLPQRKNFENLDSENGEKLTLDFENLMHFIALRPLSKNDLAQLFSVQTLELVEKLLKDKKIFWESDKNAQGIEFLRICERGV